MDCAFVLLLYLLMWREDVHLLDVDTYSSQNEHKPLVP